MNPENGLCLSATYDAAFDKHLISFDNDYRMIVRKEIKEYYTNEVATTYFGNYEGKQLILPSLYLPMQSFYFPMQIIVLLDNQSYSILPVQKRYYFGIGIERKVLISKYSSSNFVMQI